MVTVRSETVRDYPAIAEIEALAFCRDEYIGEIMMVAAQRHGPVFDPELALVAEVEGLVVGHALFYPHKMYVGGRLAAAVSLAPLAVHPSYQGMGVGSLLMSEGHRRAREKGYAFSFLLGHPSYYPRFGYLTHLFGACKLHIPRAAIPQPQAAVTERQVQQDDLDSLVAMWHTWFAGVDLALFPGPSLLGWISHRETVRSAVLEIEGEVRGYVRYPEHKPTELACFLAADPVSTQTLLAYLNTRGGAHDETLCLPLHPQSLPAREWLPWPYTTTLQAWDAGMIKILDETNREIVDYCHEVAQGLRLPGQIVYPPIFEIA